MHGWWCGYLMVHGWWCGECIVNVAWMSDLVCACENESMQRVHDAWMVL